MIERIKIKKTNFTIAWNGEKNDNDPTRFVLWIGETKKGLTENEANLLWNQILSDYMIVNALKNPSEIFSNKKIVNRLREEIKQLTKRHSKHPIWDTVNCKICQRLIPLKKIIGNKNIEDMTWGIKIFRI